MLSAASLAGIGQNQGLPKPLDPSKARANYSFPVHAGGEIFRFKVEVDKTSTVTGVSVFHADSSILLQTLPTCDSNLRVELTEYDEKLELLEHADLNFDGFEDLKLLQYDNDHLGKKLYCIYLWDNETGRFLFSPELTEVAIDPVAHPESKTITTRSDWQGGAHEESTYRWNGGKLELIQQNGLYGDWALQNGKTCHFTFSCRRLINGKMVTTLEKPVCTPDEMEKLPECPVRQAHLAKSSPGKP
jgi:hypothetical protein